MAGHSAWSNIASHKGVADKKRANLFTKLSRLITVAAREGGGGDMVTNARLRMAIEQARAASMPKENIERAVKRGTGESREGADMREGVYAISLPGPSAIVETISDNPNRTVNEIRGAIDKEGGIILNPGSLNYAFIRCAVVRVSRSAVPQADGEAFTLAAIDAGATDVQELPEGYTLLGGMAVLPALVRFCESKSIAPVTAALEYVPKNYTIYTPKHYTEEEERLAWLAAKKALEELDDVQEIYWDGEWRPS